MAKPNKRLMLFIIPLIIFMILVVMFFMRLGKPTEINTSRLVGNPLPNLSLPLLSDTTRTITKADFPDTPFILNVWGSWCLTCHAEHPFLLKLHEQGVPIIGVNYKDELSEALAYLNKNQDPFVYSVQDVTGDFALDLGLMGAPESYVVGTNGIVYQHIIGEVGEKNWDGIQRCLTAVANDGLSDAKKIKACHKDDS